MSQGDPAKIRQPYQQMRLMAFGPLTQLTASGSGEQMENDAANQMMVGPTFSPML